MEYSDEILKKIEEAARKGAKEGAEEGARKAVKKGSKLKAATGAIGLARKLLIPILIIMFIMLVVPKLNPFNYITGIFDREGPVSGHDMTLANHGIFGYKAADFEEAILGDRTSLKKLEIYSVKVSDVTTITDAGLGGFKIFSKNQILTYHGTAIYTVDLAKLTGKNISYDKKSAKVTLTVPKPVLEDINIPAEKIEVGEVKKGILSFGQIKFTPEQLVDVQTGAKKKMKAKLKSENIIKDAEEMAKSSLWSIYQPLVNKVARGCTLEIQFEEKRK